MTEKTVTEKEKTGCTLLTMRKSEVSVKKRKLQKHHLREEV